MVRDTKTGAVLIKPDNSSASASKLARQRITQTEERLQKLENQMNNLTMMTEKILEKLT